MTEMNRGCTCQAAEGNRGPGTLRVAGRAGALNRRRWVSGSNRWLSCDPAQRTWMEIDTYIPRLPLGKVMAAASVGVVVESKHPDFVVGDLVSGAFGWQDYAVSDGSALGGLVPAQDTAGSRRADRAVTVRNHRAHSLLRSA